MITCFLCLLFIYYTALLTVKNATYCYNFAPDIRVLSGAVSACIRM